MHEARMQEHVRNQRPRPNKNVWRIETESQIERGYDTRYGKHHDVRDEQLSDPWCHCEHVEPLSLLTRQVCLSLKDLIHYQLNPFCLILPELPKKSHYRALGP